MSALGSLSARKPALQAANSTPRARSQQTSPLPATRCRFASGLGAGLGLGAREAQLPLTAVPAAGRRAARTAAMSEVKESIELAAGGPVSPEMEALEVVQIAQASSGRVYDAASVIRAKQAPTLLIPCLTHFGDLDSWELGLKMSDRLPELQAAGVTVMFIGIGSLEGARKFAVSTSLPLSTVYADTTGKAARVLGFVPGVGRKGGALEFLGDLPVPVNGYAKLLLMCAGVGSPGTLKEVLRGFRGDKTAKPVFNTGSAIDLPWKDVFDRYGEGYQRPFELATLRLMNMIKIARDWDILAPRRDSDLLVQRGGVLLFQDKCGSPEVVWRHDDKGVLGYANVDEVVAQTLEAASKPRV